MRSARADAPAVRVRYRRGPITIIRRARAGAVQLLGAHASVSYKLTDKITLATDPRLRANVCRPAPGGTYAAGTFRSICRRIAPADLGWTLSFDVGPWLFGPTSSGGGVSAAGGGLPLPDFTNWHAGLTFTYRVFQARPHYTDTNLSKENLPTC